VTAFDATVEVAAPTSLVWDRLVDWPAHSRWVPLTRVRVLTPLATGVGARFVGRSSLAVVGLDRVGFDDPMEVVLWEPPAEGRPGRCEVRKLGRLVRGSAGFVVAPLAGGRTRVTWHEDLVIAPAPVTRLLAPLVALVGRLSFERVLTAMGRELEAERRR
jgi:hypothetical protein